MCGGNSSISSLLKILTRVHPRVCGGNSQGSRIADPAWNRGTSPRVRGKPLKLTPRHSISAPRGSLNSEADRYIPACAGETLCWNTRRRGAMTGTSPRVRGKLQSGSSCGASDAYRYIPACAGETLSWWRFPRVAGETRCQDGIPVHPRVCGGNSILRIAVFLLASKSVHPRVCGGNLLVPAEPSGLIMGVHPRVCGGNRVQPKFG